MTADRVSGDWRAKQPGEMSRRSQQFRHIVRACMVEVDLPGPATWELVEENDQWVLLGFTVPADHYRDVCWWEHFYQALNLAERAVAPTNVYCACNYDSGDGPPPLPVRSGFR